MKKTLAEIANFLSAELPSSNLADVSVVGFATLSSATSEHITFINDKKYLDDLLQTKAAIVLANESFVEYSPVPVLVVNDAYIAFAKVSSLFSSPKSPVGQQIDSKAVIDSSVQLPNNIAMAAGAVIGANCRLADGVTIGANSVVADNVSIGYNSHLSANVTILHDCVIGERVIIGSGTVIGSEGFGNAWDKENNCWHTIYHGGRVVVGNDVAIGANNAIDRGTIEDTIIADGVRIDNLVMVAHNCHIGKNTALAGQVGMAGHTHIGANVKILGQAGLAGHMSIADDTTIMGKAMISKGIQESGQIYGGYPAQKHALWQKEIAGLRRLIKKLAKGEL